MQARSSGRGRRGLSWRGLDVIDSDDDVTERSRRNDTDLAVHASPDTRDKYRR